ncbi:disulfide bond formation protein B [Halobacillus locisalis]|uniref:Probable disulfide formation protein n=1 Tax=Halobacillus locisalis TaxID=220753 RepID=A0A838CRH0_9BACI|nr:disulfide oxidoreductase [Halobacillus locisalis]MBA2174551.1 disulfide bond formation protein B [Halobacillus locisalis]
MKNNQESYLFAAWAVALVAMAGSLFYSEVLGYEPCEFCWYQRILMYPLVLIYGVALVKKNSDIALPGVILSGLGMLVSTYQYMLQKVPGLSGIDSCGSVSCSAQYVNYFGFVTIPFMAGMAFVMIFVTHLLLLLRKRRISE